MAGFLDKQDTIVDFVLTDEGKRQLSVGELEFVYYAFFDDEVDYNPYITYSGTLSEAQLSASIAAQIEASPVREAVTGLGYKRAQVDLDRTCVNRPLFTMPQGQSVLPRATYDPTLVSGTIEVIQRKVEDVYIKRDQDGKLLETLGPYDRGYERQQTSAVVIDLGVDDFFDVGRQDGFLVRVFKSASEGLVEVPPKRDFAGDFSFEVGAKAYADETLRRLTTTIDGSKSRARRR